MSDERVDAGERAWVHGAPADEDEAELASEHPRDGAPEHDDGHGEQAAYSSGYEHEPEREYLDGPEYEGDRGYEGDPGYGAAREYGDDPSHVSAPGDDDEAETGYDEPAHDDRYDEPAHGDQIAAGHAPPEGFRPCHACGEPVERRQLVCLSCGGRVALGQPGHLPVEPVIALIVALVVAGSALFGFAIAELTSDSNDGDGAALEAEEQAPPAPKVVDGEGQPGRAETERAEPSEPKPARDRPSSPFAWPRGVKAHTVVLVSTGDRAGALRVAEEARSTGLEAGLLPSEPYDLGTDLWIVFSGRFTTLEGAARQAAQLDRRYPGAYPQLIQRSQ
ncbi:MAG TPA: SPOR domain-containing protein [Thermoleophilaceae bacterium]|nr:SPOR domain-containing protein [Thermoleophilaceae bacterium]